MLLDNIPGQKISKRIINIAIKKKNFKKTENKDKKSSLMKIETPTEV